MKLTELTFNKLYQQIVFNLKNLYSRANSSFTLASPFGQILQTLTALFQLNTLNVQNVQRSMDLNDAMNNNAKTIRALATVGQYNPSRGQCASGGIRLKLKQGVNITEEIGGTAITFFNRQKLKNLKNNFDYILDLNQDTLTFTLYNDTPINLSIVQGTYKTITFTGTGEKNQSFVVPSVNGKEIDNYKFLCYVNGVLWQPKRHKFDMLLNEQAYVPLTSFSGGVDIIFGNGDEGMIPELGSIITFEYLVTDGQEGNLIDSQLNEFKFIDLPVNDYGADIDTDQVMDIDIDVEVTFGSNGDTPEYLKSILPYASSNFVLAGPDQYTFFLKRLGLFSMIDVYTTKRASNDIVLDIYKLAKTNTDMLNKVNNNDNNTTYKQLIEKNLKEIQLLRKLVLTEGGDNLVNIFLMPDIKIFYGQNTDINYFNVDINAFLLDDTEKKRILNYLSQEGLQIITNEVKIIDPIIKKYVINITARLYDDAIDSNVMNEMITKVSDYFINEARRDRIPPSDLIRILDDVYGVDSVTVEFISEENENYHKEFIIKSEEFFLKNKVIAKDTDIIMSDGNTYDVERAVGMDSLLGDILIEKNELPLIRGGFTDRYNNEYSVTPGVGAYSPVNILILPQKTSRKQFK